MIKLYCESWRETLKRIEDQSVQMVFLDPPYGISSSISAPLRRPEGGLYNGMANVSWDSGETLSDWQNEAPEMLSDLRRVLTPTGTLIVCGSYHGLPELTVALKQQGWWILNEIIWFKTNACPNFSGRRLGASHENLLFLSQGKSKRYKFNNLAAKQFNDGKQLRDVWVMQNTPKRERLVNPETGKSLHPSQKSLALLERLIAITTDEGDLIWDPFAGTGTTLVKAGLMGRGAIGSEIDSKYAYLAQRRINNELRDH